MYRFSRLRRITRFWWLPLLLVVLVLGVPLLWIGAVCDPFDDVAETAAPERTPALQQAIQRVAGYARNMEQSYLTFPEWYIVYSAEEYAAFIQGNRPSRFPYFGAVGQYWQSYADVCANTRGRYVFNSTYHITLYIIGISFTVENIAKGLYENTAGRMTEWFSSSELTEEDAFAREVATEYGKFMHMIPWFKFPFHDKLIELWATTGMWGQNPIRKWERKFVLSLEYGGKALYGGLIRKGAQVAYEPDMQQVHAVVTGTEAEILKNVPEVVVVEQIDEATSLVSLPRYEDFTQTVPKLTRQGVRFTEIAGNEQIMVSVLAPEEWTYPLEVGEVLFVMVVLTQPHLKRMAINVPVSSLHTVLATLEGDGVTLEHLYDY